MYDLSKKPILIIDCQTTGTHPKNGHLLQMGWSVFDPTDLEHLTKHPTIEKWFLKLPAGYKVPHNIKKMLNISEADLVNAVEPSMVFNQLQIAVHSLGDGPIVIAHYAQFERCFLQAFYLEHADTEALNFELLCSQRIAKRLLPNLPSYNLKAMAGFLKGSHKPRNEAASHVAMTLDIWRHLIVKCAEINISDYRSLSAWLSTKHVSTKPNFYSYNIDKLSRLNLSTGPGIYRMLAEDKTILYIGKATSLKSRVNSYFRGIKNRDRRIMEMLTQVWGIETVQCQSPLEAALLESDEIKRWHPPYNILLKSDDRSLVFYNHDYSAYSVINDTDGGFCNGPYRPQDPVMLLLTLLRALKTNTSTNTNMALRVILNEAETVTAEDLNLAWQLFCEQYNFPSEIGTYTARNFFVLAYNVLKDFEKAHGKGKFETWWKREKKIHPEEGLSQPQRVANKIFRLFVRAAEAKRRSRCIKRLFNADLMITATQQTLTVINGEVYWDKPVSGQPLPTYTSFDISHYDRLSIILSAKHKKLVVTT